VTTAEVAVRDPSALETKIGYANFLAKADLLPRAYQDKPANLLYAIEYGAMLGLPPMAAIVGIHVIDGRPTMSAGLMAAKVRQAGHRIRIQSTGEGDNARARCTIIRSDDPDFEYSATWTMERAKTAGLLGKMNWRQHPIQMLKNRATSECCRDACQEVLLGIHYTPDELGGEDDGGELIADGYPTLANGQIDQTQMSEQAKDAAGMMPRHQRVEHDELRDMNKINPADLEHVREEPDDDDPWQTRKPAKGTLAPKTWTENLSKLIAKFPLGPDEDVQVILQWLTGRAVELANPVFTRSEVKLIADVFQDHLKHAQGDYEVAASKLWQQHAAATAPGEGEPDA
jgi:hypothetical protein